MKILVSVCGVAASVFCFGAGVYLVGLQAKGEASMIQAIANGMGYYFIGKGFFVLGALLAAAHKMPGLSYSQWIADDKPVELK